MHRTTTTNSFAENNVSSEQKVSEKKEITEISAEPRPYVIQNILSYSKALKVEKSANIGTVENLMN